MSPSFDTDELPGKPKILFIGLGESSHTHSWIELLNGAAFNVRLFALPSGSPPPSWPIKTYLTEYTQREINLSTRSYVFASGRFERLARRSAARLLGQTWASQNLVKESLAKIVREWRPDIIHTLGMDPSGEFYFNVRRQFGLDSFGKWVLQTRGASDLPLRHIDPELRPHITEVLRSCDLLINDNQQDLRIARELGVRQDQIASLTPVPGTGGIDVDALATRRLKPSSQSRLILWPKAYESPWSKALPTLEALKLCWSQIQPCEVHILATTPETRQWHMTLPQEIKNSCRVEGRIPRDRVLELMTQARVMIAPSLLDGVPNSLYEAMAGGAFPIVSPLESICPVVEQEKNVLFARNLYPNEIAGALTRAMLDDELVDATVERNLTLVRRIANRSEIRPRVIEFYQKLVTPSVT
jgi:glycosyltransferase involved in cell wall biosynthesis